MIPSLASPAPPEPAAPAPTRAPERGRFGSTLHRALAAHRPPAGAPDGPERISPHDSERPDAIDRAPAGETDDDQSDERLDGEGRDDSVRAIASVPAPREPMPPVAVTGGVVAPTVLPPSPQDSATGAAAAVGLAPIAAPTIVEAAVDAVDAIDLDAIDLDPVGTDQIGLDQIDVAATAPAGRPDGPAPSALDPSATEPPPATAAPGEASGGAVAATPPRSAGDPSASTTTPLPPSSTSRADAPDPTAGAREPSRPATPDAGPSAEWSGDTAAAAPGGDGAAPAAGGLAEPGLVSPHRGPDPMPAPVVPGRASGSAPAPAASPAAPATGSASIAASDAVRYLRELGPARAVQRLAVDLDGATVALRIDQRGAVPSVRVHVVDDPGGRLDATWTDGVERTLERSFQQTDSGRDPRRGRRDRPSDDDLPPPPASGRRWAAAVSEARTR